MLSLIYIFANLLAVKQSSSFNEHFLDYWRHWASFLCLLGLFSSVKYLLTIFFYWVIFVYYFKHSSHTLDINSLSVTCVAIYSPKLWNCGIFTFFLFSFRELKFLILLYSNIYIFPSGIYMFISFKRNPSQLRSYKDTWYSLLIVLVLPFTFECLLHLELAFLKHSMGPGIHFPMYNRLFQHRELKTTICSP